MNFARAQAKNQIPKYVRIAFRSFFDLEATTRMMKLAISIQYDRNKFHSFVLQAVRNFTVSVGE